VKYIKEYIREILIEGKIEKLQQQYPKIDVEYVASKDPSKNNKYLPWMMKQLDLGSDEEKVYSLIAIFHKNVQRLKNKDINSYRSIEDLEAVLSNLGKSNREKRAEVKAEGAKKIGGNEEYNLYIMLSRQACFQYGSNTKWCITSREDNHFDDYAGKGVLHYFALRKEPIGDSYDKVAIATYPEDEGEVKIEINDAKNKFLKSFNADLERQAIEDSRTRKRTNVLYRLASDPSSVSEEEIINLIYNKNLNVRFDVANMIDPSYLPQMMNDKNDYVRMNVANRIDPSYLPQMMNDESPDVRIVVAERIDPNYLPEMMNDEKNDDVINVLTYRIVPYLKKRFDIKKDSS
jgi:hypothetical protein